MLRRLNRVPLLIAGLLLVRAPWLPWLTAIMRGCAKTGAKPEEAQKPEAAPVFLKDAPDAGFIPRDKEPCGRP